MLRTFNISGYRHVHLEGLDQSSLFVHISIADCRDEKVNIFHTYKEI